MKWGSYFAYPGDPAGIARITQEYLKRIDAMTTAFITKIVEKEFAEPGPDITEKMNENVPLVGIKTDSALEASEITMRNALQEGPFKRMVENAIAEITASSTARTNRRTSHTMSVHDRAAIVEKAVKTERARAVNEAPSSSREQNEKMSDALEKVMAAMEAAFGRATIEEVVEGMSSHAIETSLAKLGDLLTPESYIAELRFNEALDLTIERAHARLTKFQAARARKAPANVNSLQPGWAAHRR
jgi:hypothetical protein